MEKVTVYFINERDNQLTIFQTFQSKVLVISIVTGTLLVKSNDGNVCFAGPLGKFIAVKG